jgi:hypothetical protein
MREIMVKSYIGIERVKYHNGVKILTNVATYLTFIVVKYTRINY